MHSTSESPLPNSRAGFPDVRLDISDDPEVCHTVQWEEQPPDLEEEQSVP
jgi:hypothetical protein